MNKVGSAVENLKEPFRLIAQTALDSLQSHYGERLISLAIFGSIARGTATPVSDLDLLIVADGLPKGRMPRVTEFLPCEEEILGAVNVAGLEISPIIKTPREVVAGSPLFWDMTEDVIILFDRGGFLGSFLLRVKERLAALKAHRVFRGNAWYWILKEDFTPGEIFEI
jgi:hypothetical protein